jgi:hypothetical protein
MPQIYIGSDEAVENIVDEVEAEREIENMIQVAEEINKLDGDKEQQKQENEDEQEDS